MKVLRGKRTVCSGAMSAVRVQFWRAKPWCAFVRFQSKHVYCNVSNPFNFSIEFLGTAGPAALESSTLRIHLSDRGRGRRGQRPESFRRDRERKRERPYRSIPFLSDSDNTKESQGRARAIGFQTQALACAVYDTRVITLLYVQANEETIMKRGIKDADGQTKLNE